MKKILSSKDYQKEKKNERRIILFWQIFIIVGFLFIWEILAQKEIINTFIYSSPLRILGTIKDLYLNNNLWIHIFTTLKEIIISFFLGIIIALAISIIFYISPKIAKIFDPYLVILNSLPKVALGPIIIIIFGANTKSIIVMATLINCIVNIETLYTGFKNVDKNKIKMFKTFKATKKQILFYLILPSSIDTIISSLKLNTSLTLIGVITGEFLVSKKGIGYLIIYGTQIFNLNLVMSGIFILLIMSTILYFLVIKLQNKLLYKKNDMV